VLPAALLALGLVAALAAAPGQAADPVLFPASAGTAVAEASARAWAGDAVLVYVENDEDLDDFGASERWGYLYYSPSLEAARVFSVRNGKVLVAEYLEMLFDAPPLSPTWIDSGEALEAAEHVAGRSYRKLNLGRLSTMLLMRGAFYSGDPDQTTWTLIYTSPHAPSLFVVVDAGNGSVRRTWRG
jgi:hypothetical protein